MSENWSIWKSDNQGVKEESFIQTGRRGGDGPPGWRGHKAAADRPSSPHLRADRLGGKTAVQDKLRYPGFQHGKLNTQNHLNICGSCQGRRNSQSHKRVCWRGPQGPRMYTSPPAWESAPERAQSSCVKGGKRRSETKAKQAALFPFWPLPYIQCLSAEMWVAPPWWIPKALPLKM